MAARNGSEYLAGLDDGREVWLGGEKVNVTTHPSFAGSLRGMAGYFDWQHRFAEQCLMEDPETGEQISASLMLPKNQADLEQRGRCFEQLAKYSQGMLGRTTDYVNVSLSGFVSRADLFREAGHHQWADNITEYHRYVRQTDSALTHAIIQPAIDKSAGEFQSINGGLALQVVERKQDAIVVRGAKILATLGPFADEVFVYPAGMIPPDTDPKYALAFAIPINTPGLKVVCRDHYSVDASVTDKPFSSRFDEQDAFLIFDNVEIPNNRLFIDGDVAFYNRMSAGGNFGWGGNVLQQTGTRAAVKLEFAYDLCSRMAKITNSDKKPEVAMMLGEIWCYATMTRSALAAGLRGAHDYGNGAFFFDEKPMRAVQAMMPGWMVTVNDVIKKIGSHNLLCTPSESAFDHPDMKSLLEEFVPGAPGFNASERAQIFRIAWDFAGSALGSRVELYERYYLASAPRNLMIAHFNAQKFQSWSQVEEFMECSGMK